MGRLDVAYTGSEARATIGTDTWGHPDGPYAHDYNYDVWGNITSRVGWGGWNAQYTATFNNKNQMLTNSGNSFGFTYDAAGNNTYDGGPTFTYDALGKQVTVSWENVQQSYDGDGLRAKKVQNGIAVYYLRSSVLGGQVVAELNAGGTWTRGYVYLGLQLLAVQQSGAVTWVHQDPVTKGQRITDGSGTVVSTIELDPFGGDTNRNVNASFQSHHYTTYERDTVGGMDEAMARRYHGWWSRFSQPDPYDGSYSLADPQSFNRYSYVQNDPVNFVDPSGLYEACIHEAMTKFLANLSGYSDQQAADLGRFAGDGRGGADSFKYSATNPINIIKSLFGRGPSARIHFTSEATLAKEIGKFDGYITAGNYQKAGFVLHSIEDVHGAHQGYSLPLGHGLQGSKPDRIIGDAKFLRAANEVFQLLSGSKNASLTGQQVNDLINAIIAGCGKKANNFEITRPAPTGGGPNGGAGGGPGGGLNWHGGGDPFDVFRWLDLWFEMERREWESRQPA